MGEKKKNPFSLTEPCADCPFLKTRVFHLHPDRAADILHTITKQDGHFFCHKTVTYDERWDEDEQEMVETHTRREDTMHCAGSMILLHKINRPNQMMRIAARIGLFNPDKLGAKGGNNKVYDSPDAMLRQMQELHNEDRKAVQPPTKSKRRQATTQADRRAQRTS